MTSSFAVVLGTGMLLAAMPSAFAAEGPTLLAPNDFGVGARLKALAEIAGDDWREKAEAGRTTGLEKLSGEALKRASIANMRKYGDPKTAAVGGEPLAELGEIAEGALRGMSERYGWALWTDFFRKDVKVDDPLVAAKLLNGFERGVAGVCPKVGGDHRAPCAEVDFSPRWTVTTFQTGTYRTSWSNGALGDRPLPNGVANGFFEVSWSNSYRVLHYLIKTSAKKVNCHVMLHLGMSIYKVRVNGQEPDFGPGGPWYCDFVAVPDKDGVAKVSLSYAWGGGRTKVTKDPPPELKLSFDGKDPAPLKSVNVTKVKGLVGEAAHLATNSWLEFSSALPGFLTPTSGTFMIWFKYDRTFDSSHAYHDRDKNEHGAIQWIDHSSCYQRMLFSSGCPPSGSFIGGGISMRAKMGPFGGENDWSRRMMGGEWHLLALSYDAKTRTRTWSVDGITMDVGAYSGAPISFAETFTLASGGEKPGLGGAIDEVKILPYALDENALKAEYCKYRPIRYELHDWSVGAGETKTFRFRARNESAKAVKRELKVKVKGEGEQRIELSLAPNELKDFTVDVTGDKPGLFELVINKDEPDAATFECICLEKVEGCNSGKVERCEDSTDHSTIPPFLSSTLQLQTSTLLGEYDCTKTYPTDRVALCASEVVTNGSLVYLESRDSHTAVPLAAYRFRIRNQGRPHIVEMEYPDDKIRDYLVSVYPEKWGRLYTKSLDGAGVMTGVDYPLSMKMQKKRFVFWPDSETVSVVVQNYIGNAESFVLSEFGEHPAACAAIRLYELESLPPGPVQGMAKDKRSIYEWDEDPTIDADMTVNQSFCSDRADLEFWRTKWQRIIDFMRWNSEDAWVIKGTSYNGDVTGMDATTPEASLPWNSCCDSRGRCRGWAELGADMLSRNGLGFWIRINHRNHIPWFRRLGGAKPEFENEFIGRNGQRTGTPNFLMPSVRTAYRRLIAGYRDKYSAYPGFRGVTMNEALPVYFHTIEKGYDDFTIGCFQAETGIEVPMMDAPGRYKYLTEDPARKAAWIKWRCDKTVQFAEELAKTLRGVGGDHRAPRQMETLANAEIQIWVAARDYSHERKVKWAEWDAEEKFLEAGLDVKRLTKIPGIRLVPAVRPDYFRAHMHTADYDEAYFQDSPSWVKLMREGGVDSINVFRHSNFELYPSMGYRESAVSPWKTELWLPPWNILAFEADFQGYPTPHARAPYTLDSVASLVADCDLQELSTGWWGLMENGEHDEWVRFFGQFRSVPRGKYALVKGPDDPVAVRSGEKGHYLVNREPYAVTVEYVVDGKPETLELAQHEIRFVEGRGANGNVEVKKLTIPPEELAIHRSRLETLEAGAKAAAGNAVLSRAAKEARAAFDEGRYHQFRALFHLGEVRKLFNPTVFPKR